MPEEANKIIHFLNTRNKEQLEELAINDRTKTILETKRVLTKKTLMQNLERRCHDMQAEINDKLVRHKYYVEKLNNYASHQTGLSTSVSGIKALPTGRVLYDNLENLFYVDHELKHLFPIQPTFFKYTKTNESFRKPKYHSQNGRKKCLKFCNLFQVKGKFLFLLQLMKIKRMKKDQQIKSIRCR